MMDGFDNDYSDSDDGKTNQDDGEANLLSCKACGAEFDIGAKGSSRLKELCSKCHSSAIQSLLDDEKESNPPTPPAHVSGVADKGVGDVDEANSSKVFTTSHSIIYH